MIVTPDWYNPGDPISYRRFTMNNKKNGTIFNLLAEHIRVTVKNQGEIQNKTGLLIPVPGRKGKEPIYVEIDVKR